LGWAIVASSFVAGFVVAWRYTLWAGILAVPATFVLALLALFSLNNLAHLYRWSRNSVRWTCTACGAAIRYRDEDSCKMCGADHPIPKF
jgi:hypothetical protein